MKSAFYEMGYNLASIIFHPNYYDGKWSVIVTHKGRKVGRKLCINYSTAQAWGKYICRNYPRLNYQLQRDSYDDLK